MIRARRHREGWGVCKRGQFGRSKRSAKAHIVIVLEQIFDGWLGFDLQQQKEDLDLYLSAFQVEKRTILATWIRLAPYRNLMPMMVQEPERRLYLADIEAILELLKYENDVGPLDPDE